MTGLTTLPIEPQTLESNQITPLEARVLLAGFPKVGKSTLLSEWAPKSTLILDTHKGSTLLPGEHFVQHVSTWQRFEETVDLICAGNHGYKTIGIDLVDDIYKFADRAGGNAHGKKAAGLVDWGKGTTEADALFTGAIGRLLASPYGIWFLSHTDTQEVDNVIRYVPRLDKRVRTYVEGACHYLLLAEILGPRRQLRTAPSARFQAGGRTPLTDPMPLDARQLYKEMAAGLAGANTPAAEPEKETTRE